MTDPNDESALDPTISGHRRQWMAATAAWVVILGGDVLALWRGYRAASWYRMWRREQIFDPVGSELYLANAKFDAALALVGLVMAGLGVALLLRAQRRR